MMDMDSKWATSKCIATALVYQVCWEVNWFSVSSKVRLLSLTPTEFPNSVTSCFFTFSLFSADFSVFTTSI